MEIIIRRILKACLVLITAECSTELIIVVLGDKCRNKNSHLIKSLFVKLVEVSP